ncbi:hypothetical protein E3N88_04240 [Mikania micrantha]|uniref:Uncharacterized protein n=1 Tax=Mikania micrantha TaxID=192012 RepID=A0A5N6PUE1_9ASTR|nr:hypothetical protein E3N88_04240 [Mikania micrantha]
MYLTIVYVIAKRLGHVIARLLDIPELLSAYRRYVIAKLWVCESMILDKHDEKLTLTNTLDMKTLKQISKSLMRMGLIPYLCPIYKHTDLDITGGVNEVKVLLKEVKNREDEEDEEDEEDSDKEKVDYDGTDKDDDSIDDDDGAGSGSASSSSSAGQQSPPTEVKNKTKHDKAPKQTQSQADEPKATEEVEVMHVRRILDEKLIMILDAQGIIQHSVSYDKEEGEIIHCLTKEQIGELFRLNPTFSDLFGLHFEEELKRKIDEKVCGSESSVEDIQKRKEEWKAY